MKKILSLFSLLPCMLAFAVSPLYVKLDDMPGDADIITNTVEYVDSVVVAAGSVTPTMVTNISSVVVTSMVTRSYVEDYLGIQSSGQAITNAALYAYGLSTNYTDSVVSNKQDKLSKAGDVYDIRVSELGSVTDVIFPNGKWIRQLIGGNPITNELCTFDAVSTATNDMEKTDTDDQIVRGPSRFVAPGRIGWGINTSFSSNSLSMVAPELGGYSVSLEKTNNVYRLRDSSGRWYAYVGEGGGGGGGGGGTTDYNALNNLPTINSFSIKSNDVERALDGKLDAWNEAHTEHVYWDSDILNFSYGISVNASPTMFPADLNGFYFGNTTMQELLDAKADTNIVNQKRDITNFNATKTNLYWSIVDHFPAGFSEQPLYDREYNFWRWEGEDGAGQYTFIAYDPTGFSTYLTFEDQSEVGRTEFHAIRYFSGNLLVGGVDENNIPKDPDVLELFNKSTGGLRFAYDGSSFNVYSNGVKIGTLQFTPSP